MLVIAARTEVWPDRAVLTEVEELSHESYAVRFCSAYACGGLLSLNGIGSTQ